MTAKRLQSGGRIQHAYPLKFTWCGKTMHGYVGDTLASALLANGCTIVGRSFKYHRPRGVMSAGVEESGALVTLGQGARLDANVCAATQPLFEGLVARGQNAWPDVRFDLGAFNDVIGRFLAAGFYYKTFIGPKMSGVHGTAFWMFCEKFIRRAAGMGRASRLPDPDRYEHCHDFCDLLVVGGGAAGLAAAHAAAEVGLDVMLVEQDVELGGEWLNRCPSRHREAEKQRAALIGAVKAAGVRVLTRTTAFGLYDGGVVGLAERVTDHLAKPPAHAPRQRFRIARARRIILASGALERHFAFGNNDRPGVMTASSGRAYLNRYAILPGRNIVIAANNDSAYACAADFARAGAAVTVTDTRAEVRDELRALLREHRIAWRANTAPLCVRGRRRVRGVRFAENTGGAWRAAGAQKCDALLVAGGWSPVIHLLSHRGVKPEWDAARACFVAPQQHSEPVQLAGAAAGILGEDGDACEASGRAAGLAAAAELGKKVKQVAAPESDNAAGAIHPVFEIQTPPAETLREKISQMRFKGKAFVDFQHDVTTADVRLAHREGFIAGEHLKRYTTLGMATDGGKVGNVIGLAVMADARGQAPGDVGVTTFRPPYTPVAIGALRGAGSAQHFRPLRRTPMHDWNTANGAVMQMAGLWHRPWYFPRTSHGHAARETLGEAYVRETQCVRECVGLCDVTSLGKIALQGADAGEFLNRIYTNGFAKLPVGKARYGIMLRDDGIVMDDGTTWRLSDDEYFMTTTTAHAGKVMAHLEELLQTRWQELKVHVTSVTDQWAGCAVAGPRSRDVLAACVADAKVIADDALPFMGVVQTFLQNRIACRIARISFSGELAYEVYVPSDYADAMMKLLWLSAEPMGGCLYGLEALGALRIEKGHVTAAELDGRVSLEDAGLGKMASSKKSFIGDALRKRPELLREDRPRLVGVKPKDRAQTFSAGALLCRADQVAGDGEGWITAVTHSPAMQHWIGLGFINGGADAWRDKDVVALDPLRKSRVEVEIVSPHMYDPTGERMHG